VVVLGPIEAARERDRQATVSSDDVAQRVGPTRDVHVVGSSGAAIALLTEVARPDDVMLVLSLGGFDKLAPRLLQALDVSHDHA
jgi:UDP-N-acetylmuramate-alanine ligase